MSESYPTVSGLLLAEVLDSLPARLRKKIDLGQAQDTSDVGSQSADGGTLVVHQGSATVKFTAAHVNTLAQVSCDCLLAPRCLHLALALLRCDVQDSAEDPAGAIPDSDDEPQSQQSSGGGREAQQFDLATTSPYLWTLNDAQLAVVHRAIGAFETILAGGIAVRDPQHFSTFLRLSHEAKAQRLYLLNVACGAVASLLAAKATTTRNARVNIVAEGFLIAHKLNFAHQQGAVTQALLGSPRKAYEARASLSLHALYTEPIIASSGYAGVATYLRDSDGNLWSVSSNMPQDPSETPKDQARQYYRRAPRIGGISTGHFELTRRTLLVSNVKASDDGRLSAGAKVSAVAGGVKQWDPQWFQNPAAPSVSDSVHPAESAHSVANADLRYQKLNVKGMTGRSLALETAEGRGISVRATAAAQEMGALDDFLELARHPGTALHCLIRGGLDGLELMAFQVDPAQLSLPEAWAGRVMVGLDRLAPSYFKEPAQGISQVVVAKGGPLTVMLGWLGRVVDYGRSAVVNDKSLLVKDAAQLTEVSSIHGAQLLQELGQAAHSSKRDFDGTMIYVDKPWAKAWLGLAAFTQEWSLGSS